MPTYTRRQFLACTGAAYAAVLAILSGVGVSRSTSRGAKLLWSEEFETLDLVSDANATGRWRANDVWQPIDQGYADFGADGGSWCLNPNQLLDGEYRSPFSVSDSVLTIKSFRTPDEWRDDIAASGGGAVPAWCGGILISNTARTDMTFGFGYYEFRAKWPTPGRGMFPALWFIAAHDRNDEINKGAAEIDLFEIFGQAAGSPWTSTLHRKDNNGEGTMQPVQSVTGDTGDWHTYGLLWNAGHLKFYRDRVMVAHVSGADAAYFDDCQMSIRLNYAMDAGFFESGSTSDESTPAELSMDVDYIRKYDAVPR